MIDLTRPPYARYADLMNEFLASPDGFDALACNLVTERGRGTHDTNQLDRARVTQLLYLSQPVDDEAVRFLLQQEVLARRNDSFQGAGAVRP